jgi:hypothetical protein
MIASGSQDALPTRRPREAAGVVMEGFTTKPSGEPRRAPRGLNPVGRTRRSRRAEQGLEQSPALPCAPQSARPDQRPAERQPTNTSHRKCPGAAHLGTSAAIRRVGETASRPKPKPASPETLGQGGAIALAKRLERYWHGQGFPAARFWAEPIGERFEKVGSYELYRVASNLVNGWPPRYSDHGGVPLCHVAKSEP